MTAGTAKPSPSEAQALLLVLVVAGEVHLPVRIHVTEVAADPEGVREAVHDHRHLRLGRILREDLQVLVLRLLRLRRSRWRLLSAGQSRDEGKGECTGNRQRTDGHEPHDASFERVWARVTRPR